MKRTILIVDDFENTRLVIQNSLKSLDCNILQAADGKEALKFLDGRKIDLVITDLNMPRMDGMELINYIRDEPKYEFIPIVVLTTERNPEKRKLATEAWVTAWVQKPFNIEDFLKTITKCLRQTE